MPNGERAVLFRPSKNSAVIICDQRDKRGPTVQTEANGDSKSRIPWLVCWARRAGTGIIDFCLALAALVSLVQDITLFHFISPHHPAAWAGRRAGSPVSGVSDCDILVVVDIASFKSSCAVLSSVPNCLKPSVR